MKNITKLKFKKLDERAVIPNYAHKGDCGMDVTAISIEYDNENDMYICHTGLACEMPDGYALLCLPRSFNTKTDVYMPNSPGLVDPATYRGEIQFRYKRRTSFKTDLISEAIIYGISEKFKSLKELLFGTPLIDHINDKMIKSLNEWSENQNEALKQFPYKAGDRIGQFLIVKTENVKLEEVNELSETSRGTGGFGSTGK